MKPPNLYHVSGWHADGNKPTLYCLVTLEDDPRTPKPVEIVELHVDELDRLGTMLRSVVMGRVRDAVSRLCGYRNYAHFIREQKRRVSH